MEEYLQTCKHVGSLPHLEKNIQILFYFHAFEILSL